MKSKKEEYEILGCYFTNTFVMQIGDKFDLKNLKTDIKARGTFIHEYTHFLQNVLTPLGILSSTSFFCIVDSVFKLNFFDKVPGAKENLRDCEAFFTEYFKYDDDTIFKSTVDTFHEIDENNNFNFHSFSESIDKSIQLGNIHVIEGMAFLTEYILIGDNRDSSPENPYNLLTFFAEHELPYLHVDKLKLLSIYEKSLHFINPAIFFVSAIRHIKDHLSETLSLKDFQNELDKIQSSNSLLPYNFGPLEKVADAILKGKGLEKTKTWFDGLISKTTTFITDNKYPITSIFYDIFIKAQTNQLIDLTPIFETYVGCPLIYWKGETYTLTKDDINSNVICIKLMCDLAISMWENSKYECSAFDNCDIHKSYCKSDIFQCLSEEILCPLGAILKTFGLQNKTIDFS